MRATTFLPFLTLLTFTTAISNASPNPDSHLDARQLLERELLDERQIAAGGGVAPTTLAPTQYPVVTNCAQLVTAGGVTTVNQVVYTQTFAAGALGTWDLGPTPLVGSIGLGSIQGTVGQVGSKSKRSVQTPVPNVGSENGWKGRF